MVAAEELGVAPEEIELITADTDRTPDEGFTTGSNSMSESGTAVRYAAANVRQLLLDEAARRWSANVTELRVENKRVVGGEGKALGYGELAAGMNLKIPARADVPLTPTEAFALMGTDLFPRVDIPGNRTHFALGSDRPERLEGRTLAEALLPAGGRALEQESPLARLRVRAVARSNSVLASPSHPARNRKSPRAAGSGA